MIMLSSYLLKSIVEEWTTLRGHSLCNRIIERYKVVSAEETKKKKSLRKELKRTEEATKKK